jgi:hypothetical protein
MYFTEASLVPALDDKLEAYTATDPPPVVERRHDPRLARFPQRRLLEVEPG